MSESKTDQLAHILKAAGYSVTAPRRLVFEALLGREPLSMRQLQCLVSGKIDRASLYRVINVFEQTGIVQRINIGWKYKLELTDIFSDHHHHISCLGCGKITAVEEDPQIERIIQNVAARHGITAEKHQLEIQGYCEECLFGQASLPCF